ncbi:MAG TPA: phosphatidylserine/phosphatidylglycerophosphate/cardiolipin synthase family protein [Candidatus Dormibacteraeota bacterium]|nr:phosphatidylserine/phosphatidylglycerophosphate/cardiolipin synthase family protein [Candidatus Dormibacteraeota bacterium]
MRPRPLHLRLIAAGLCAAACLPACGRPPTAQPVVAMGVDRPAAYPGAAGPFAVGADSVTVLPRGVTAFPAITALIAGATRSVDVEMYELQRTDLVDALVAARRRGVAVTVVTDPSVDVSVVAAGVLRAAAVDVLFYPVRKQMIDHVKLLVVDGGAAAVVGGINWGAASAPNHDIDLLVRGPAAANLERVLVRDLVTCGRLLAVPPETPDTSVAVEATLPTAAIRPLILAAVDGARTSIDLELYVVTDLGIVHAVERAHARGVRVRVLLDPTERPSDAPAAELRSRGVPVRLYHGTGELLHAKTMVVDARTVVVGSANWSAGGFARNHELDAVLDDAPQVAAVLTQAEDSDWSVSGSAPGPVPGGAGADAAGV